MTFNSYEYIVCVCVCGQNRANRLWMNLLLVRRCVFVYARISIVCVRWLFYYNDLDCACTRLNGTFSTHHGPISNWAYDIAIAISLSVAISVYLASKITFHWARIGNVCICSMRVYAHRAYRCDRFACLFVYLLFWRLNGCSTCRL